MREVRIPTPDLLAESPELAILEALSVELAIANHALIAANPELESDDFIRELPGPAVQVCLADAILTHITGLQSALERYRTYVLGADRRREILPAPEF